MKSLTFSTSRGYSLLDALIALLVVALSLFAAVSIHTQSLRGAGDAQARTRAIAIAQANIEGARSIAVRGNFDGIAGVCGAAAPDASYTVACSVSTPAGGLEQRLVQVTVSWTDRLGATQRIALNSLIGWDNLAQLVTGATLQAAPSIAPLGVAKVGVGQYTPLPQGSVSNNDGTSTYRRPDGRMELIDDATGNILLYIDRFSGQDQDFVRIKGNVYFDQNAGNNALPSASDVRVRLSSEGLCIYDNAPANLIAVTGGSNSYAYFAYTCYVGAGWYGNVGVTVDDDVSGQAGSPTICLGDPGFNAGVSNGTLTSAHTREASVRTFRGFKAVGGGGFLSTGMENASVYPSVGTPGSPRPSDYPSFYPGYSTNVLNHHFLLTRIQGNASCKSKMEGGVFAQNSGKYFCIAPDNDLAADACPAVWPGFESEVGQGGAINYSLSVSLLGNGGGSVSSSPTAIACGQACSASFAAGTVVTLTATPGAGSTFGGWGGCDSVSGSTCTVTLSAAKSVTASFDGLVSDFPLTVSKAGTGSGTVTSSPGSINCGSTCTAAYGPGTTVVLTATPAGGSTFGGWSGDVCSGTGTCTVTMSQAQNVTATFTSTAPPAACNVVITGSRVDKQGTITLVSPADAGSCTGDNNAANYSCTLSLTLNPSVTVQLRNQHSSPGQGQGQGQGNTYNHLKSVVVSTCGSLSNVNFP